MVLSFLRLWIPGESGLCHEQASRRSREFTGILNEVPGNCATNRPCIIQFNGQDYFIYHNGALKNGGSHRRSVCIDKLKYNEDGTMQKVIMSSEGILPVGATMRQL